MPGTSVVRSCQVLTTAITQSPSVSIVQNQQPASVSTLKSATPSSGTGVVMVQSPTVSISQVQLPSQQGISSSSISTATNLLNLISKVMSAPGPSTSTDSATINPNYLFWLMFVSGNISRCQGCSGKILRNSVGKPLPPPEDLILQHKEQVLFQNPNSGVYQMSREHRNVYYHARLSCVQQRFPSFSPQMHIRINKDTFCKLLQAHKDYVVQEFGLQFVSKS